MSVDPTRASATRLFETLKAEAAVLRRKQQRKGVEYRVKEGTRECRPTAALEAPSGIFVWLGPLQRRPSRFWSPMRRRNCGARGMANRSQIPITTTKRRV